MRALEPLELLLDLLPRLLRDRLLLDLLLVVLDLLGELLALAELRLDRLELLAEEVLALALVHLALRGGGDLLLHRQHVDLAREELVDLAEPLDRVEGLEDRLRLLELEVEVRRGEVGEARRVVEVRGDDHHLGRDVLAEADRLVEVLLDRADERLDLERTLAWIGGSSIRVIFALKNGAVWMK